jgi:hypothetical protein
MPTRRFKQGILQCTWSMQSAARGSSRCRCLQAVPGANPHGLLFLSQAPQRLVSPMLCGAYMPRIPSLRTSTAFASRYRSSLLLSLVQYQLDDDLAPLLLRMLQAELDSPVVRRATTKAVVEALDIAACDDLPEATILRVPYFNEILVEEENIWSVHGGTPRLAHKLHYDGARDVAVLVDVYCTFGVAQEEFLVREAEHAEWVLLR